MFHMISLGHGNKINSFRSGIIRNQKAITSLQHKELVRSLALHQDLINRANSLLAHCLGLLHNKHEVSTKCRHLPSLAEITCPQNSMCAYS